MNMLPCHNTYNSSFYLFSFPKRVNVAWGPLRAGHIEVHRRRNRCNNERNALLILENVPFFVRKK